MSQKLFNRFIFNIIDTGGQLFCSNTSTITLPVLMAKNVSQSAVAAAKPNRIKIKGKSKFPPGIVKFQVLGSGAKGAPRCLYLFTDHSRYVIVSFTRSLFVCSMFNLYIL